MSSAHRRYDRHACATQPPTGEEESAVGFLFGLSGAESHVDRRIPTWRRGEPPRYAGFDTFLQSPFVADARACGDYDVAVLGASQDCGPAGPGVRFGPRVLRRISLLHGPYGFGVGGDLRASITMCDLGDVVPVPGDLDASFDRIAATIGHVYAAGALPVVLGGDRTIGSATVHGVARHLTGDLGVIRFGRRVGTPDADLDARSHATSGSPATGIPNSGNLVQVGVGGWQAPRPGGTARREGEAAIFTVGDVETLGIDEVVDRALEAAWDGAAAVWLSFDVGVLDVAFVPGTGWPEFRGLLPREALALVRGVASRGLAGVEIVACSPPRGSAEIMSLIGVRVVCDVLATLLREDHLPRRRPTAGPATPGGEG